ncbi:MAG: hypothetical protein GPJ50_03415 [Candidatus Heimdallarchaeota archaeon]|nr:hypothetical protein [Candidatus Heimdallarchaeota archaeon]
MSKTQKEEKKEVEEIDLEQYIKRQRETEEILLPSGLRVIVRKRISPIRNLRILGDAQLSWEDLGPNLEIKKYTKFCEAGFKELLVKPKVPEEMTVEDIEDEDFPILHSRLMENYKGSARAHLEGLGEDEEEGKEGEGNKDFSTSSE